MSRVLSVPPSRGVGLDIFVSRVAEGGDNPNPSVSQWISTEEDLLTVLGSNRTGSRQRDSRIASEALLPSVTVECVQEGPRLGAGRLNNKIEAVTIGVATCKRRRQNPSVKRPDSPVAPE